MAEGRGQRHLETGQRVEHHPLSADLSDRADDLVHRLIDGEAQWPDVDDLERSVFLGRVEIEPEGGGPPGILVRELLEDGDDPRLALAETLGDELRCKHRLA